VELVQRDGWVPSKLEEPYGRVRVLSKLFGQTRRESDTSVKGTASRLGAVLAVLFIVAPDILTPGRYRVTPVWLLYVAVAAVLGSIIIVRLSPGSVLWRRGERVVMITTILLLLLANALNLLDVVDEVVFHSGSVRVMPLIFAAIAIWCLAQGLRTRAAQSA
jgi:hypothetical protein